jgi:hypothetical protein
VRHFGRLREKCENSYPRKILLSDMVARVIKVMLRHFFREKMRFDLARPFSWRSDHAPHSHGSAQR